MYSQKRNYFIYFAVVAANLITFTSGGSFSWTSPILPKLRSTDPTINPLPRPITIFEESWIAAIMNLGAVIGPLTGGVCSEKFGKKKTLLSLGVLMVTSHLLCTIATEVWIFLVARFLIGNGVGAVFGVVPGYVVDIAEVKNRGVLGSIMGLFSCCGVVFIYFVGPFLSVRVLSLINVIPMVLFYLLFGYFVPESPYDLVRKGNSKSAEESLMKLRNKPSGQVEKELAYIIKTIEARGRSQDNIFSKIFKNKALTKGLLISNGLMFFQQLSGICAIVSYMQSIFESAGSSISSVYAPMLVGVIQIAANITSSQLVDRAGRRILLIISYIFVIISLTSLGIYFFLKDSGKDMHSLSWLPIASLIMFVVAFNLGLANLPWVLLAELFPENVKGITSTITTFFVFFLTFLITMCFPYLSETVGMAGSFWIFAAVSVAGFIFVVILVPETKGKSIQEIQCILEGIQS